MAEENAAFWDITACNPLIINRHVGTTVCLLLQGRIFSQSRNQREEVLRLCPSQNHLSTSLIYAAFDMSVSSRSDTRAKMAGWSPTLPISNFSFYLATARENVEEQRPSQVGSVRRLAGPSCGILCLWPAARPKHNLAFTASAAAVVSAVLTRTPIACISPCKACVSLLYVPCKNFPYIINCMRQCLLQN
jgi:hypothetical protein